MLKLDLPVLFALPHTPDGERLAKLLFRSCLVATLHFCLVIGTFGAWRLCTLWVLGPFTLVHHAILTILLHKHKLTTYETGLVPEFMASDQNFVSTGFVWFPWFLGAGKGMWIPWVLGQPTLGTILWGLATQAVGIVEFFVMGFMTREIKRLRSEGERKDIESPVLVDLD